MEEELSVNLSTELPANAEDEDLNAIQAIKLSLDKLMDEDATAA